MLIKIIQHLSKIFLKILNMKYIFIFSFIILNTLIDLLNMTILLLLLSFIKIILDYLNFLFL